MIQKDDAGYAVSGTNTESLAGFEQASHELR